MVLTLALASNIEYVRGRINGEAVTFEQDLAGSWVTKVDQSSDNRYELDLEMEDANRDYVTINPDDSEKSEEAAAEEPVEEAKAEDADAE